MKKRDEDRCSSIIRCSQKLDELVKNGNCSSPHRGEGGTARRGTAGALANKNSDTIRQRNVRDPSVYLFVNEGDETGNLIFGLCFPMAPIATERMPLEPERSAAT